MVSESEVWRLLVLCLTSDPVYGDDSLDSLAQAHQVLEFSDVNNGHLEDNFGLVVFYLTGLHAGDIDARGLTHSADLREHSHGVGADDANLSGVPALVRAMPLNGNSPV